MPRKGKLLAALDAHRGRDFEAEKRKKQVKNAEKRKRKRAEEDDNEEEEEDEVSKSVVNGRPKSKVSQQPVPEAFEAFLSDEDEEEEEEDSEDSGDQQDQNNGIIPQPDLAAEASASEAEQDSDLALSDLSEEDREDIIPHQRMTINNGPALVASRKRISIVSDKPKHPFHYHNSLVSADSPADTLIPDAMDDETRELMFYKIARDATITARSLLKKEKIPFSRPADYFAEMVKTDDHMEKVKKKLYDEAASKKAAQEARRLRDAKKFGKQVQVAKEQERAKEKKETLNKIKELKRKRKDNDTGRVTEGDDLFQEINVDSSTSTSRMNKPTERDGPSKRQKRDSKFGFGGKKKYSKSGTAESSGDLSGFSARRMKGSGVGSSRGGGRGGGRGGARGGGGRGGTRRPGKSRRAAGRS